MGDGVQVSTTLPLPSDTTLDGVMQQTWDDGRISLGSVTAPTGWNLEYRLVELGLPVLPKTQPQ